MAQKHLCYNDYSLGKIQSALNFQYLRMPNISAVIPSFKVVYFCKENEEDRQQSPNAHFFTYCIYVSRRHQE